MSELKIKELIAKTFNDIASGLETGSFGARVRVGLTTLGSEHGTENLVRGAELAAANSGGAFDIVLIGPKFDTDLEIVEVNEESEMHKKMEELLDSGYIHSCVTMHYNFNIGTSTVGRVITPGKGRPMYLATTTGTSSPHRTEAMVKNALYGIVTAKAMGIASPTVGILNLDGARQTERALRQLDANGYKINFTESLRADGGVVMRGNDLLGGSCDVMVTDTLTGNVLMKMFSSYTTGGDYESLGDGYGPGVGPDMRRIVLILSRASGVPVVANAIAYGARLAKGKLAERAHAEFEAAEKAGLADILASLRNDGKQSVAAESASGGPVAVPEKEVVTGQISGIDILDLEDAVQVLWKAGIYAESGMGCTGPIVLVSEAKLAAATKALAAAGYVAGVAEDC